MNAMLAQEAAIAVPAEKEAAAMAVPVAVPDMEAEDPSEEVTVGAVCKNRWKISW